MSKRLPDAGASVLVLAVVMAALIGFVHVTGIAQDIVVWQCGAEPPRAVGAIDAETVSSYRECKRGSEGRILVVAGVLAALVLIAISSVRRKKRKKE